MNPRKRKKFLKWLNEHYKDSLQNPVEICYDKNMEAKQKKFEEGGVLGLFDRNGLDVPRLMYYGLYALQHRGQTGCGIVCIDNYKLSEVKGKGLVSEVIEPKLNKLKGQMAAGHVRYGLASEGIEHVLPLNSLYLKGSLTISLAGSIYDSEKIKLDLENEGGIFQVGNDAEILAHLIAKERIKTESVEEAVFNIMERLEGAYAAVVLSPTKLLAFRDKKGLRPLCMGVIKDSYVFASEDVALEAVGAEKLRDVMGGELIVCSKQGARIFDGRAQKEAETCIYEYMYFARPDSVIDNAGVYDTRINAGRELFKACPVNADVVIGVPSAGLHYALGFARESGIPFGDGLIRNYYVGRTTDRDSLVREGLMSVKLNVLRSAVNGQRVALVDDSMIRGITAKKIIARLKESGAKEVHLRIACPRFSCPCPHSPSVNPALWGMSEEEIRLSVGADSLGFLPFKLLDNIGLSPKCCKKCFM